MFETISSSLYKDKEMWKTAHICLEHRRGVLDSCSSVYSGSLQSSLLSSCHVAITKDYHCCHLPVFWESIENYYFCPLVILKLSTIAEIHNKDKRVYILASCQFLKNCIAIGCYSKFRIFLIWIEQGE